MDTINENFEENVLLSDILVSKDSKELKTNLENALTYTKHGRFQIYVVFIVGLSVMINVAENVNVSLVMPFIKCELKFSMAEQSMLNSIGFIGILVSSHFWGFLADTWGRQKVMRTALAGSFIFGTMSAFSSSILILLTLRFVVGLFISGIQAASFTYVSEFHTANGCTKAVSFVTVFMPAAFIFLPFLAYVTIPIEWNIQIFRFAMTEWRLYILTGSLLNAVIFCLVAFLPESPKFLLAIDKKDEALEVLRCVYASNSGNAKEKYPVTDLVGESTGNNLKDVKGITNILRLVWNQTWPVFVQPHASKTVKMSFLMFLLFSIGHGTFMWFSVFITKLQPYTNTTITLCTVLSTTNSSSTANLDCNFDKTNLLSFKVIFLVGIIFTALSAAISQYIDKIGKNNFVYASLLLSATSSFSIIWLNQFYYIATALIGFLSCSLCATILGALSVSLYPTNIRAMATCVILMIGRAGAISGSHLIGLFIHNYCTSIFFFYFSLLLGSIVVYYLLVLELKRTTVQKV